MCGNESRGADDVDCGEVAGEVARAGKAGDGKENLKAKLDKIGLSNDSIQMATAQILSVSNTLFPHPPKAPFKNTTSPS